MLFFFWEDSARSMLPIYQELIAGGIKIWVFSDDTDAVVPVTGTRYAIGALKLQTMVRWYRWYYRGEVGGWCEHYNGLTFVTVRGGGHEVPLHKPRHAFLLFEHYLRDTPLPWNQSNS